MNTTENTKFESILAAERRVRVAQTVAQFGTTSKMRVQSAAYVVKFRRELFDMLDNLSHAEMIEYGKYRK